MSLRGVVRSEAGGALIELAFALPLLVVIAAATVDFGRIFYLAISLSNAARAGAQYGSASIGNSAPSNMPIVESITTSAVNISGVSASASRLCQCSSDTGTFSPTSPANDCTASCGAGHMVITVTVTASKTFTSIMGLVPGIPNSIDLSRAATLRVAN